MLFSIFSRITQKKKLSEKIANKETDVYLYILFPIAVAFLITFSGARLLSHVAPWLFIPILGLHVHHYSYGFIILAVSGYLALVNYRPRDKYLISLLHGFGLGLSFDEFGLWLHLADNSVNRYSYDGVLILIGLFTLLISAESGSRAWRRHFARKAREKGLAQG